MKTKYFNYAILLLMIVMVGACKKDTHIADTSDENSQMILAKSVAKQLNVDVNFKSVEMRVNDNFSILKNACSDTLDYSNSKLITFVTINNSKRIYYKCYSYSFVKRTKHIFMSN